MTMPAAPRFSIIMPAYNGAAVIHRAIDSILCQTCGDFELLLVDDHSTDNTLEVAYAYAAGDRRIKVFRTSVNSGGPAVPKNLAIEKATGEIVVFCDQDDCYTPHKLERFDAVFTEHPETGLLFCDYWVEHTDRQVERYAYLQQERQFLDKAAAYLQRVELQLYRCRNFIGCICSGLDTGMATISVAIRRSSLLQEDHFFDPSYRVVDDIDLWMRLAARLEIKYLDEALSIYFSSPSSLSARKEIVDAEAVRVHDVAARRFDHLLTAAERAKHRALRSRMAYRLACTRFAEAPACLRYAMRSWVLRPSWLAAKLIIERSGRVLVGKLIIRERG